MNTREELCRIREGVAALLGSSDKAPDGSPIPFAVLIDNLRRRERQCRSLLRSEERASAKEVRQSPRFGSLPRSTGKSHGNRTRFPEIIKGLQVGDSVEVEIEALPSPGAMHVTARRKGVRITLRRTSLSKVTIRRTK